MEEQSQTMEEIRTTSRSRSSSRSRYSISCTNFSFSSFTTTRRQHRWLHKWRIISTICPIPAYSSWRLCPQTNPASCTRPSYRAIYHWPVSTRSHPTLTALVATTAKLLATTHAAVRRPSPSRRLHREPTLLCPNHFQTTSFIPLWWTHEKRTTAAVIVTRPARILHKYLHFPSSHWWESTLLATLIIILISWTHRTRLVRRRCSRSVRLLRFPEVGFCSQDTACATYSNRKWINLLWQLKFYHRAILFAWYNIQNIGNYIFRKPVNPKTWILIASMNFKIKCRNVFSAYLYKNELYRPFRKFQA